MVLRKGYLNFSMEFMVKQRMTVLKKSERLEELDPVKIADSIFLAAQDVGGTDRALAQELAGKVMDRIVTHYGKLKEVPSVVIGDSVERILLESEHYKTAKAYILNRDKKRKMESAKRSLGVHDDVGVSYNELVVIKEKYIQKDDDGEPIESVKGVFERVARFVAGAEKKNKKKWETEFERVMRERKFIPGGRTLANAGTANNQLANCFVMPMPDDIEGIFESLKESSILKKYGGGVGFNFGHIRPKDDIVSTTSGGAAGPVALMQLVNDASDIYLQAGKRRSGNMVTLPVSHPDIMEFIHCKEQGNNLPHINYSIAVTKKFMEAAKKDHDWDLINPRNGKVVQTVKARMILEEAARMAWRTGDPGLIFIDRINKDNPTPHVAALETVNLCGEQPLLSYEACNLGSINLAHHINGKNGGAKIDWEELERSVRIGVRMLDDVVSVCKYPLKKVEETVRSNRKIGLGVMGWADILLRLGIPYDKPEALSLAEKLMKFVSDKAHDESAKLGREKGSFPNFKGSLWEKRGYKHFRNATVTTIAPTGTIAIVAGCSSGIEPHFAIAYIRKSMGSYDFLEVNEELVKSIKYVNGLYSDELMDQIAEKGSVQGIKKLPAKIRRVFVTSGDVDYTTHVKMLAAFQKYTDNAVSKTINMPESAKVEDVMRAFYMAGELDCKGITVYRDKSKSEQVLNVGAGKKTEGAKMEEFATKAKWISEGEVGNECPQCGSKLVNEEGCKKCYGCGFAVCG